MCGFVVLLLLFNVSVAYDHCKNLPQTSWLRTAPAYYLTVMQLRGPHTAWLGCLPHVGCDGLTRRRRQACVPYWGLWGSILCQVHSGCWQNYASSSELDVTWGSWSTFRDYLHSLAHGPEKWRMDYFSTLLTLHPSDHSLRNITGFKGSCDFNGHTWIIQENLPISMSINLMTSAKSLCQVS